VIHLTEQAKPEPTSAEGAASELDALERIFAQIAEAPASNRETLLEELCPTLKIREQVRRLLGADSTPDPLLDNSLFHDSINFRSGDRIGPYKILQEIGQGGMGVVYMAEQIEPVRRKVALKILKAGLDTRQVIARFDAERQALSMMDHPHIAKVFEAGATDSGRPYFAMELVQGQPITEYCNQQQLSPQQRLKLFLTVCLAIQHAHQKGIIHRDIKPSNVLVVEYDGQPMAKVIDFGVAKALSQPLTEKTMFTGVGEIIGTLEYMSPEQARVNQLDIDTRSDIYSLGVMLYELLTGSAPVDKERLRSVAWDEMLRIIREEDPPKPSTRLSDTARLPSIAEHRPAEMAKLSRLVRGELDWIVMKALEKDRNRRYATTYELANDIQCYLNGDAVTACPPSAAYRFSKFARRNKIAFVTSTIVATSLVLGLVGTSWQAFRATRAEKVAMAERDLKDAARAEAVASAEQAQAAAAAERRARKSESIQRKKAEAAIKVARAVNDFLQHDLLGLAGAESQLSAGLNPNPELKLVTLLERALDRVDERFAGQPHVKFKLQATLSKAFESIGRYDEATQLLESVLENVKSSKGSEDPETLRGMNNLAALYTYQSKLDKAEPLMKKTLETRRRLLGNEHPDTLSTMNNLAVLYKKQARYDRAESLYKECLEVERRIFGDDHLETAKTMSNLALLYDDQTRYEEAEQLLLQSLAIRRRALAPEHPEIAVSLSNLGLVYRDEMRYDEAEPLLIEALEIQRQARGPEHPDTITVSNNLAQLYKAQGRYEEAERILMAGLDVQRRLLGPDHGSTLNSMNSLGLLYMDQRRFAEAEPLLVKVLEIRRLELPAEHLKRIISMNNLAVLYHRMGKLSQSIALHEETLQVTEEVLGRDHSQTLTSMASLGVAYLVAERTTEGLQLLEDAYSASQGQPELSWIGARLATVYADDGKLEQALALTNEQLEQARRGTPVKSVRMSNALANCGSRLLKFKAWSEAEPVLRECVAIRETNEPDSWRRFNACSMLGEALTHRQRFEEAEQLLLLGHEGLQRRSDKIPSKYRNERLTDSMRRLVALYQTLENEEGTSTWQSKLESFEEKTQGQTSSTHFDQSSIDLHDVNPGTFD
jgi:serine/threonine protein kinase